MRGRRPHPTAVKLLRNNPGRRPLNPAEPQHEPVDPAVPALLTDPVAIDEWQRIVGALGRGHVTLVDRGTLIGYCHFYGRWQQFELLAATHAPIIKTPSGRAVASPAIGMANKAFTQMLKAAVELGITPSSRARVVLAQQGGFVGEPTDAFTAFQNKRRF